MPAISDASPLILYNRIGRIDLLRSLFDEIIIPQAVNHEIVAGEQQYPESLAYLDESWIRVEQVMSLHAFSSPSLDLGEAEVISLAQQLAWRQAVILDDYHGRQVALRHGLRLVGSAGVLLLCRDEGLIDDVRPWLDALRVAGMHLSDDAYQRVLRIAGE